MLVFVIKCLKVLNSYLVWDGEAEYLIELGRGLYPCCPWNEVPMVYHVGASAVTVRQRSGLWSIACQGKLDLTRAWELMGTTDTGSDPCGARMSSD